MGHGGGKVQPPVLLEFFVRNGFLFISNTPSIIQHGHIESF